MLGFILTVAAVAGSLTLIAWGLSWSLTRLAILIAEKTQVMSEVNFRSSHRIRTPRLGGAGITAGLLFACGIVALGLLAPAMFPVLIRPSADSITLPLVGVMAAAILGAFLLGLWDDISDPPAIAKLIGQLILAIVPPLLGWRLRQFHFPGMNSAMELPPLIGIVVSAVWILALMNAVNFMDGINGLAGRFGEVVAIASFIALFQSRGGESVIVFCAGLFGGCGGFLYWNLYKGRTFMGDCGSQPLGLFLALLGIHIANLPTTWPLPFVGYIIIVSPFLFDVGITLVKRLLEGRNVLTPHREHLYQRHLIATGENHDRTLFFFESHHIPLAVVGVLYIFMLYRPSDWIWQLVAITFSFLVLVHYAWRVLAAEDRHSLGMQ